VTNEARRKLGEYHDFKAIEVSVGLSIHRVTIVVLCGATAIAAACASTSATTAASDGELALGTWGGDSSGLIVSDTAMHLHVACTYGDVSGRIPVAANGEFDVQGSYMLRAYPITVGPSVPARFVGRLSGKTVTITVTVDDTVQHQTVTRGPVVLTYGAEPRLGPCPICRRPIITRSRRSDRAEGGPVGR